VLASRYGDLKSGDRLRVIDAWRARAAPMLNRRVEWESGGTRHSGFAENIDDDGALIVKGATGTLRIRSGEVRWL
jgi:biotin-(acetyl-CoA carboxylase) ligase